MDIDSLQVHLRLPFPAILSDVDFVPYLSSLCNSDTEENAATLFKSEITKIYDPVKIGNHFYEDYYIIKISHTDLAFKSESDKDKNFPAGDYPICDISVNMMYVDCGTYYLIILGGDIEHTCLYDNTSKKAFFPETDYKVIFYKEDGYHSISHITPDIVKSSQYSGIYTLDGRRVPRAVPGNVYIIDGKLALPTHEIER